MLWLVRVVGGREANKVEESMGRMWIGVPLVIVPEGVLTIGQKPMWGRWEAATPQIKVTRMSLKVVIFLSLI